MLGIAFCLLRDAREAFLGQSPSGFHALIPSSIVTRIITLVYVLIFLSIPWPPGWVGECLAS